MHAGVAMYEDVKTRCAPMLEEVANRRREVDEIEATVHDLWREADELEVKINRLAYQSAL